MIRDEPAAKAALKEELAIKAAIYREIANTFGGMDPRRNRPVMNGGMFQYSSSQAATWDSFTALGQTFAVLAGTYEKAALQANEVSGSPTQEKQP